MIKYAAIQTDDGKIIHGISRTVSVRYTPDTITIETDLDTLYLTREFGEDNVLEFWCEKFSLSVD